MKRITLPSRKRRRVPARAASIESALMAAYRRHDWNSQTRAALRLVLGAARAA